MKTINSMEYVAPKTKVVDVAIENCIMTLSNKEDNDMTLDDGFNL